MIAFNDEPVEYFQSTLATHKLQLDAVRRYCGVVRNRKFSRLATLKRRS